MKKTGNYTFGFQELDKTKITIAGGKGANLDELTKIKEISIPIGFIVSTDAFNQRISRRIIVSQGGRQKKNRGTEQRDSRRNRKCGNSR